MENNADFCQTGPLDLKIESPEPIQITKDKLLMSIRNKIFARLDSLDSINSPPSMIKDIMSLLNQDDSTAARLSAVILKDPGLTAKILKVANSSFYGYKGQVKNINQAVMILGQTMVKYLVLSISICNHVAAKDSGKEQEYVRLWQHFLETASIARNIAMNINYGLEEEAYVAGLLHDFGRLLLLKHFGAEVFQTQRLVREGSSIIEAERKIFDTDHQEIGEFICKRWNLPESLAEILGNHHPERRDMIPNLPLLARIVILADNLSSSGMEMPENLSGAALRVDIIAGCTEALGLDLANIKKYYTVVSRDVLGSAEGLDLDLGDAVEYLSKINTEVFQLYIDLANIFRERQELSGKMLTEERLEGTLESLHIALATLSHYINNASMNISGQCEVLQILYDKGDTRQVYEKIPSMTKSIKSSIKKISLILEELSKISSLESINYFKDSRAIDIEQSLKERLEVQ